MAFVRTAARQMGHGLERVDVSLSMRKWWKLGYTRQNGLITKTLSPFEQRIITPMLDDAPTKILKYLKRWSTTILPAFVITYSTVKWADWEFDQIHREHWD
ncbi:Hypothetical protein NocV09_01400690 [Nannochloropsis oceanica]